MVKSEDIGSLIIKHRLQVEPIFGDIEVDEDSVLEGEGEMEYWNVLNCSTGGCWHSDVDLLKAIERAIGG